MRPQLNAKYSGGFDYSTPMFYKGGGTPQPTDPMKEAQAQIQLEQERARLAAQESDRQAAIKSAQDDATRTRIAGQVGNAYNSAEGFANSKLSQLGINDDYGLLSSFNSELDRRRNGLDPMDASGASQLGGSSIWDSIYTPAQSAQRSKLRRSLDTFAGTGFEEDMLGDTSDDAVLNSIMGDQYNEALGTLQRAKDRGQINDTGWTTALAGLNKQKSAGLSKLSSVGMGVLDTDRGKLSDLAGTYYDRAANYDFGDQFDVGGMKDKLTAKSQGYLGSLQGDILGALGDTNYFDTNTLLGTAGVAQGAQNTAGKTNNPLAAAFANASLNPDDEANKRTNANVGVL